MRTGSCFVIGAPGFEPGTSATRTQRSTGLSHAPCVISLSHYVRAKVSVHEYEDGGLAVFHGTLRLGRYDAAGRRLGKAGAAA